MRMDWEDVDDEEPELIFPYQSEGPPYPPHPASLYTTPMVDIAGFRALSAAQETARVESIRLRKELEDVEIRYTLMRMGRERAEKELYSLGALPYYWYERTVRARDDRAVRGRSLLPELQGPPSGSD
nr:hypothetical protein [Tanacetum cinerariifolium]